MNNSKKKPYSEWGDADSFGDSILRPLSVLIFCYGEFIYLIENFLRIKSGEFAGSSFIYISKSGSRKNATF